MVVSGGAEMTTDRREAGFMIRKSSATTAKTPATEAMRAATLNSAARRSKSRVRVAGLSVAFEASEAERTTADDLMGSDLTRCETDGPSFAALSLNLGGE